MRGPDDSEQKSFPTLPASGEQDGVDHVDDAVGGLDVGGLTMFARADLGAFSSVDRRRRSSVPPIVGALSSFIGLVGVDAAR